VQGKVTVKFTLEQATKVQKGSEIYDILYIYLNLTAVGLTPGGSSTSHIYTNSTLTHKQYA
jgi:hypothetical protein